MCLYVCDEINETSIPYIRTPSRMIRSSSFQCLLKNSSSYQLKRVITNRLSTKIKFSNAFSTKPNHYVHIFLHHWLNYTLCTFNASLLPVMYGCLPH